jgi:hypothetical protein
MQLTTKRANILAGNYSSCCSSRVKMSNRYIKSRTSTPVALQCLIPASYPYCNQASDGSEDAAARVQRGTAPTRALRRGARCDARRRRARLSLLGKTTLLMRVQERRGIGEGSLLSFAVEKRAEKGFQVRGEGDSCGVSSCGP